METKIVFTENCDSIRFVRNTLHLLSERVCASFVCKTLDVINETFHPSHCLPNAKLPWFNQCKFHCGKQIDSIIQSLSFTWLLRERVTFKATIINFDGNEIAAAGTMLASSHGVAGIYISIVCSSVCGCAMSHVHCARCTCSIFQAQILFAISMQFISEQKCFFIGFKDVWWYHQYISITSVWAYGRQCLGICVSENNSIETSKKI